MNQDYSRVCRCEGWWEQESFGRQPMENLRIAFEQGRIHGTGSDMVGPFVLSGTIDARGNVVMQKQYVDQHHVEYTGVFDGEGMMSGQWRIDWLFGLWAIRIRSFESDGLSEISEFVPRPTDEG